MDYRSGTIVAGYLDGGLSERSSSDSIFLFSMKTLLLFFGLSVGFSAMAQSSSSREVTNDGRQLRIRVDIERAGRTMHYNRSFDISALDRQAVDALENRVLDSLSQVSANHRANREQHPGSDQTNDADDADYASTANPATALSPREIAPASVLFRDDKETGRLWMQYIFRKDGDELVIERTVNAQGKSDRAKQAIIRATEQELGIKSTNQ